MILINANAQTFVFCEILKMGVISKLWMKLTKWGEMNPHTQDCKDTRNLNTYSVVSKPWVIVRIANTQIQGWAESFTLESDSNDFMESVLG